MSDTEQLKGIRKDGKPYKPGNTRDDGSYAHGKNRPPAAHRFQTNDGRTRGRRAKGTKNLLTEWREELEAKIPVTEGGKTSKVTKRRGMIKSSIDRAIKKSDRAAEIAFRYAELSEKREPGLQADDHKIIAAWLASLEVGDSDDADMAAADVVAAVDDGEADDA